MTSFQKIYDAFLAKIKEDDWCNNTDLVEIFSDWEALLETALPYFRFPRISLDRVPSEFTPEGVEVGHFVEDLNDQEIQIIATLMKTAWLDRTINSWENVKTMYDERDFSQANLLNNFIKLLDKNQEQSKKLQKIYSRSRQDGSGRRMPYDFSQLAGKR